MDKCAGTPLLLASLVWPTAALAVDCRPLPVFEYEKVYAVGGLQVQYKAKAYKSYFWSQHAYPDQNSGPWEAWIPLGNCDPVAGNLVPQATLDSPAPASQFTPGSNVLLAATASDPDGSITQVEFFIDGYKVGAATSAPYRSNWTATAGTHTAYAVATDNDGASATTAAASFTVHASSTWQLAWSDEFNGSALDHSKWNYEVSGEGGGNKELQYYTNRPQNVYVSNGMLVIQALRERYCGTDGCRDFTSGRVNSAGKADFTYGRWEARAKLPYGRGLWPAIWALPTDEHYGGYPASGEIDIMEAINLQAGGGNTLYGTIHVGPDEQHIEMQSTSYVPATSIADHFHVYAMEWEPGEIRLYVDNQLFARYDRWTPVRGTFPAPFDQRFHWILNVAVGGLWPGNPDATTVFPQKMEIDYVRVYRKP